MYMVSQCLSPIQILVIYLFKHMDWYNFRSYNSLMREKEKKNTSIGFSSLQNCFQPMCDWLLMAYCTITLAIYELYVALDMVSQNLSANQISLLYGISNQTCWSII